LLAEKEDGVEEWPYQEPAGRLYEAAQAWPRTAESGGFSGSWRYL